MYIREVISFVSCFSIVQDKIAPSSLCIECGTVLGVEMNRNGNDGCFMELEMRLRYELRYHVPYNMYVCTKDTEGYYQ